MADETLDIDGRRYVSSTRAAKLVGYTKDYVGQLARAGKLDARLIGRSWYVAEDSIRRHKLSVHYTLSKPKQKSRFGEKDDEKTSKSKDISYDRLKQSLSHTTTNELSQQQSKERETTQAKRVLADADIRFESGEALSENDMFLPRVLHDEGVVIGEETSDTKDQSKPDEPNVVRTHAIRTSALRTLNTKEQKIVMSGGVVHGKDQVTIPPKLRVKRGPISESIQMTQRIEKVKRTKLQGSQNKKRRMRRAGSQGTPLLVAAKKIPVVAAVVTFVLFVLWFVVFR